MTKTNNIIVINGKHYDAVTGHTVHGSKAIDDVLPPGQTLPTLKTERPVPQPISSQPTMDDIRPSHSRRTMSVPGKTHKAVPSKTLMRHAVKKPAKPLRQSLKVQTRTDILARQPEISVLPKLSIQIVDPRREARARRIARSKLISRFDAVRLPAHLHIAPASIPALPQALLPVAPTPTSHPSQQSSMDIFHKAIKHAHTHEQHSPKSKRFGRKAAKHPTKRRHLANSATAALAVIVLGGFLAYQNVSNVTLRLASGKAGFAASMPGYKPSGFSIGKFAYSPGNVTINFHSNSDDRHFALVEAPSNWDSETLMNEYVALSSPTYQTVQSGGRTIYVYGQNNATWVDRGVWYRVEAKGSLSSSQVVSLASSM